MHGLALTIRFIAASSIQVMLAQTAKEWAEKGHLLMESSPTKLADPAAATECYEKAATLYNLQKLWDEAASLYEKVAKLHDADDGHSVAIIKAATTWQSASLAHAHTCGEKAEKCMSAAVALFQKQGDVRKAAEASEKLAEIQQTCNKLAEALVALQCAADCHEANNSMCAADISELKIAALTAALGKY